MSKDKWDRFKRAFGAEPTDDLINVRNGKVQTALGQVLTEIGRLTTAGLDGTALTQRHAAIELRRTQALALGTNREKGTTLDGVKDDARDLAEEVRTSVQQQLDQLDEELATLRKDIKTEVDGAEKLSVDYCQAGVAAALLAVKTAAQQAELRPTKEACRAALELIDLAPLKAVLVQAQAIESSCGTIKTLIDKSATKISKLEDGQSKTDLDLELQGIKTKFADFAKEPDLAKLKVTAEATRKDANTFFAKVGMELINYETVTKELTTLTEAIKLAVDQAEAIPHERGKAIVAGALDVVKKAAAKAQLEPTAAAKRDELKKIDVKPLTLAIVGSQKVDAGVPRLMSGLESMIGKLGEGEPKNGFLVELGKLKKKLTALNTEDDLETAKQGFVALRGEATEVMNRVIRASGQDGFKDALKARFGVDVRVKDTALVNLAKTYQMLEMVPEDHVGHEKVKDVYFNNDPGGGGAYGDGTITMENIRDNSNETYEVDGVKVKANSFNVTMLHEIGHAVDDKYKIMDGLMEAAGYGEWKKETKKSVAAEMAKAALKAMGNPDDPLKSLVEPLLLEALGGTAPTKPDSANRDQWKVLQKFATIADTIRDAKKPWFNATPAKIEVDGRVYVESYAGKWHSYKLSERAATRVNDYQWRSPAEWFAEIYGICWLTKKKPPSGAGAAIQQWLPA